MARTYLTALDLAKNELQNGVVHNLAAPPGSPARGQLYFNTSDNTLYYCENPTGPVWVAAKSGAPSAHAASHNFGGGDALASNGAAGTPMLRSLGTASNVAAAGDHTHALDGASVTATLPQNKGGTNNAGAYTLGGVIYQASSAFAGSPAGTSGQVLKSGGAGAPSWATLAKADVGLSNVANVDTTNASNIATGTLPTAVLPPLAVNEVFTAASESAMLALSAQRGDMCIRTDTGKTYVLSTDSPGTLADWKEVMATGQVVSVAGKTGVVTLVKADVGLGSVDNTSDAAKPVSTLQAAADALKADKTITVTPSAPLTGGGDLSANRTLAISSFAGSTPGAVPTSPGGTTAFLRADGTWNAPAGGGTVNKYAVDVGGATSQVITHGLGNRDVVVNVYRNSTPWDTVECDVERTSTTTCTLRFTTAPGAAAYRAVVTG